MIRISQVIESIKKLWYWVPIIWKDRDWDSHYIYEILKHKLKSQSQYIGRRDLHTRAQQDARRMMLCVKLIQICQDETYSMEYMDYSEDRVWFTPLESDPDLMQYNSETLVENYNLYFKKYPLIYKRVMNGEGPFTLDGRNEGELMKIVAMNISHINQSRVQKLLFKIMEENINGWWD